MTDGRYTPDELELPEDMDIDTGEPIAPLLQDLEVGTGPDFLGRVRRGIDRQLVTNSFVVALWNIPKVLFVEILTLVAQILQPPEDEGGGPP